MLRCCCLWAARFAAVKNESPKTASGAALHPGLLVAFKKDERTELGLVLQPDGKKNWWIANVVSIQNIRCLHDNFSGTMSQAVGAQSGFVVSSWCLRLPSVQ